MAQSKQLHTYVCTRNINITEPAVAEVKLLYCKDRYFKLSLFLLKLTQIMEEKEKEKDECRH